MAATVAAAAAEATGWVSYQVSTLTLCTRLPLQDSAAAIVVVGVCHSERFLCRDGSLFSSYCSP